MEKIPMTENGFTLLQAELSRLKNIERPEIIKAISDARELGDLSENAEYHAAKERQSFIEGRILELEDKTSRADVINVRSMRADFVRFGANIQLEDVDSGDIKNYQIVGSDEADIRKGLLSITSPLARALINKSIDDVVEVVTPNGGKSYAINAISYE
ncbi:MAG: transcription elongation factor GreA [Alphaproteobacteria bacterium]|nr:transcription elongation factor GreA [Alphaproteobacteria bacterium]